MSELATTKKTKRRTPNTTTKKCSLFSKIPKILGAIPILALLGLLFQIFIARPHIIVDEIRANSPYPSEHEFIIKNSGDTTAYNLSIILVNPNIVFKDNLKIEPYKEERVEFTKSSIIEGINVPPGQSFLFRPCDSTVFFSKTHRRLREEIHGGIREAEITLEFRYNDFLHIPYKHEIPYCTSQKKDYLIWKPVGPEYQKLKRKAEELPD